jgi:predicted dehydrogenase
LNRLRLAIIGAGIISQAHLKAAVEMPEIELTAIAEISKEKAEATAEEYGMRWYTDYIEMMDAEKPDAVIIALPHFLHKPASLEAAKRGIHILLEKPMANNVDECNEIMSAAKNAGIKLMIGHIVHFADTNIKIKEIIKSRIFGELVMISDTRFNNYFRPERPRWFLEKKLSGGGMVMNLGAHSIDAIQWITGSKVKSVTAKVTHLKEGIDIEGSGQLFLELENGVTAAINLNGYTTINKDEKEYMFENGIVKVANDKLFIAPYGKKEYEEIDVARNKHKDMITQLQEFYSCIFENRESSIPGEYGRSVISAIEAAYESSATGKKVVL